MGYENLQPPDRPSSHCLQNSRQDSRRYSSEGEVGRFVLPDGNDGGREEVREGFEPGLGGKGVEEVDECVRGCVGGEEERGGERGGEVRVA